MKSKIEQDIIRISAAAINSAIEQAPCTVGEVAKASFITKGFVNQLKAGKKRLNIVHIFNFAKAMGKYPSELLPLEWQKPAEVDKEKLQLITGWLMAIHERPGYKFTPEEFAHLVTFGYGKIMKNPNITKELFYDTIEVILEGVKTK